MRAVHTKLLAPSDSSKAASVSGHSEVSSTKVTANSFSVWNQVCVESSHATLKFSTSQSSVREFQRIAVVPQSDLPF
eukprot:664517-Prymnesium_polylepis.3